jgi:hypothetical protein
MTTRFLITCLEEEYRWRDICSGDCGFEYATEVLEVPETCIETVTFLSGPDRLELILKAEAATDREAWYSALIPFAA